MRIPHSGNSLPQVSEEHFRRRSRCASAVRQLSHRLKFIHDGAPFSVRLHCESAAEFPARPGAEAAAVRLNRVLALRIEAEELQYFGLRALSQTVRHDDEIGRAHV